MTAAPPAPAPEAGPEPPPPERKFSFPSALTILALVTVAVWLLAFLIPAGQYDRNESGAPVAGSIST